MKRPEAISGVPGINLMDLRNRKAQISSELMSAATEAGFFYVTGKDKTCRSCSVQCEVAQRSAGGSAGHGLAQADIDVAFDKCVRSAWPSRYVFQSAANTFCSRHCAY